MNETHVLLVNVCSKHVKRRISNMTHQNTWRHQNVISLHKRRTQYLPNTTTNVQELSILCKLIAMVLLRQREYIDVRLVQWTAASEKRQHWAAFQLRNIRDAFRGNRKLEFMESEL